MFSFPTVLFLGSSTRTVQVELFTDFNLILLRLMYSHLFLCHFFFISFFLPRVSSL